MKKRLSEESRQILIDYADMTIYNLKRLRREYFEDLYDDYLQDVDHAIRIIESWRGLLDGSVF